MKKLFTFLLAFCILCGMLPFGNAANASEYDNKFVYYCDVVYGLDMIPEKLMEYEKSDTIRGADFADTVCMMMNISTEFVTNQYFYDVDANSDEGRAVNALAQIGILKGNGTGYFNPDAPISGKDAVRVCLNLLGYDAFEETLGYYDCLLKSKITDCTEQEMTYGSFVRLVFEVLHARMLETVSYGTLIKYREGRTFLYAIHNIVSHSGVVTANAVSAKAGYDETRFGEIRIDDVIYNTKSERFSELLGYPVEFYYEETDSTPNLVYASVSDKAEYLFIKADDVIDFENYTYKYQNGSKEKTAKVTKNHCLIVNGVVKKEYVLDDFTAKNGDVILISSKNGVFDTVIINTFVPYLIDHATAGGTTELIITMPYNYKKIFVDFAKDNCITKLYIDGVKCELEPFSWDYMGQVTNGFIFPEIAQNSLACIFADEWTESDGYTIPSENAKNISVHISTKSISGTVDSVSADSSDAMISGQNMEIAPINVIAEEPIVFEPGVSGDFILDYDGKIAAWCPDKSTQGLQYGYLINADTVDSFNSVVKAKLMDVKGNISVFDFNDKVRINGKPQKDAKSILSELGASAKLLDQSFTISQPVKYDINENGKIFEIETVLASTGVPEGEDSGHLNRAIPREKLYSRSDQDYSLYRNTTNNPEHNNYTAIFAAPKICIFHVPTTETFEDEDYAVAPWAQNYGARTVDVFDVDDYLRPQILVSYDDEIDEIEAFKRPYVMVQKTGVMLDDDGMAVSYLKGAEGYGDVIFYSEDINMFSDLNEGDIVKIYGKSYEVDRVEMQVAIENVKELEFDDASNGVDLGDIYELYDYTSRNLVLQQGTDDETGKREFQRGCYWQDNVESLLHGTVLYDGSQKEGNKVKAKAALDDMKTVKQLGNDEASRIYIIETNAMSKFIVIYNNLD